MSIYIHTNEQTTGPFEDDAVMAWLQTGQLSPEVLACRHGATQWQPLRTLLPVQGQPSAFTTQPGGAALPEAQAVVNWARQSFPNPVELKLKFADVGRGELAKLIDADGVETRGGQRFRWETLQAVSYRKELQKIRSPAAGLILALMTRGQEKLSIRLKFQTGDAVITPFMHNQKEVVKLFETIPVQRGKF